MSQVESETKADRKLGKHCSRCGKTERSQNKTSITSWIFISGTCKCAPVKIKSTTEKKPSKNRITGTELETPKIKKFDVLEFIGQGGMGSVYKVKGVDLDKALAIKVLRPEFVPDHIAVKRFEQEALAASKLTHPNLVRVFGHGETDDGSPYLVMEYLDGESLQEYIDRVGKIEPEDVLDIFIQVCGALSHAHSKGVIHRDLTPGNIILTFSESEQITPRVVDFGIAKMQHDMRSTQDLTETGSVLGSPSYMSPEQCLGASIDSRADIYSLGCVIFESLTGEELFNGDNPVQVIAKHLEESPDKLKTSIHISRPLQNVISTCIQRDISKRYQSAVELGIDLQKIKEGKEPEFCMLSEDNFERWSKKKPVILVALSLVALMIFGCLTTVFPKVELFGIIRLCLVGLSFLAAGFAVSRIIKTVLSCAIRTVRLVDLVSLSFYLSLLFTCFFAFTYCVSKFSGYNLNSAGLESRLINCFALSIVFAIVSLVVSRSRFKTVELFQGKYDTRAVRWVSSVTISITMTTIGYLGMASALSSFPQLLNAQRIEADWVRNKEIDTLNTLISNHDNSFVNQDSKIAGMYKYVRALRYFQEGNINYALSDFDSVIKTNGPAKDSALIEKSIISWCLGRPKEAIVDVDAVLEHDPHNRDALMTKAVLALGQFNSKTAIKYYEEGNKIRSTITSNILTYYSYRLDGQDKKAKQFIQAEYKKDKDNKLLKYLLGQCPYNDLMIGLPPDVVCNTKVMVGWDMMLNGNRQGSNKMFREAISYVEQNGLKWQHGIFYGLAKSGLNHNQESR